MYLIVGLGNPEPEYSYTRHNMGFDVINIIAKKCEIDISRTKFNGLYGSGIIKDRKSYFIKTTNIYESKWSIHKTICGLLQNTIGKCNSYI